MPYGDPDPEDPTLLVGVSLPGDAGSDREMAYAFAEEFAALGQTEEQLLRMFENPRYAGPHGALERLGEEEVRRIVRECSEVFGRVRVVVRDAPRLVKLGRREEG
jgi:hypothetical protein